MSSLKPICIGCRRFYRVAKNGVWFLEGMPKTNGAPPGTVAPEEWRPYKLWRGDLWRCEGCGSEIISGVAREPIAEHFDEPRFSKLVADLEPFLQVNDC